MWFKTEKKSSKKRSLNIRRGNARDSILLVSARLSDQRRERVHKYGAIVLVIVVLIGAGWGIFLSAEYLGRLLFSENPRFTIRHLEITSDGKLQPRHIREFAGVASGANLFAVNLNTVRQELSSVPLINSVEVRRDLPDTLVIKVSERTAIARLGEGQSRNSLAVDRTGFVLGPTLMAPDLPVITGFSNSGLRPGVQVKDPGIKAALRALELSETPALSRFVKIMRIDSSNPEYLDIILSRGERVLLSINGMDDKLGQLCDIIKKAADIGKAIYLIDMTVDKNFPVQYQ